MIGVDFVAENGMFDVDGGQTVFRRHSIVVDRIDALVEIAVLIQITS